LLDNTKGTIAIGGEMHEKTKYMAPTIVKDVFADDALMSECV
jgi:aldehyde dehydrogenase (NAD+)/aldehyde dehydrogenase (NAD(P)+)